MTSTDPIKRKLVIVGDGACGKTCLLAVFHYGEFPKEHVPTVFEHNVAEIRIDGRYVSLSLWDTAGQEEYERLRHMAYAHSNVILIAYSIDSPDSLENVMTKWIDEVRTHCPGCPVILVGCKKDLRDEGLARGEPPSKYISTERGQQVAQQIEATRHVECSSLTGYQVDKVFEYATRAALSSGSIGYGGGRDKKETTGCCMIL
jgi:Rho family protein